MPPQRVASSGSSTALMMSATEISVSLADLVEAQRAKPASGAANDWRVIDHETRRPRRAIALVPA